MNIKTLAVASAAVVTLAAAATALAQTDASVAAKHYGEWGIDLTARDTAVRPGADFNNYANGAWNKAAVIPADQGSLSVGYDVYNLSQRQLRAIIDESAKNPGSATARQVGDLYSSFMDEARLETVGDKPLRADLARVRAVTNHAQMAEFMGSTQGAFGLTIFGMGIGPDDKNPTANVVFLGQAGLGLPERDYYTNATFKPQRDAYRAYIARALKMVGWDNPEAAADAVLAMETKIAEVSWPIADRRDSVKVYNPMTVAELKAATPGFDWDAFMRGAGLSTDRVIVAEKSAFPKIAAVYAATPIETLRAWQAFHVTDQASPYLSRAYVDSRFEFTGKALQGLEQNRERWKRAVTVIDGSLGEAVGRVYVERYFPAASKAKMEELVGNLKAAMAARIDRLDWMSPATRAKAKEKLERQRVMVGYPDKWRDYSSLRIDRADLYGNVQRSGAFEWAHQRGKLAKPVDPAEWLMNPQEVNAYNDGSRNVIVFPAAFLQAPYFDPAADPAVNYGAIGGVIGHEITHGYDDQGRHYDAFGRLEDWWTPEDAAKFEAQAARLGAQYDKFEVAPGVHVNGKLTMGENIADLGGLLLALDAYHASLGGKPAPVLNGLTGDQRVFLSWAQVWQSKQREDAAKQQVASDPHSPAEFRINGTVRNIDAWYAAFGVTPADAMFLQPTDRVRIW